MAGYGGFLTPEERTQLLDIMRKRKTEALRARRANVLLALDDGKSVQSVAEVLYLEPNTIRTWLREFRGKRLASVEIAAYPDREGKLDRDQEAALRERFLDNPPRNSIDFRDTIHRLYGVEYSRGGATKLMHRLGLDVGNNKLNQDREAELRERFLDDPPRNINEVRDTIHRLYGVEYSYAGAAKLMHRLGLGMRSRNRLRGARRTDRSGKNPLGHADT